MAMGLGSQSATLLCKTALSAKLEGPAAVAPGAANPLPHAEPQQLRRGFCTFLETEIPRSWAS